MDGYPRESSIIMLTEIASILTLALFKYKIVFNIIDMT